MLWAQSTIKDYIRAEHKLHSIWAQSTTKDYIRAEHKLHSIWAQSTTKDYVMAEHKLHSIWVQSTTKDYIRAEHKLHSILAQSTTKDYIRAEHKLPCISKLFISQIIIPQVFSFFLSFFFFFLPIYIPRAPNTGTCIRQGDLLFFFSTYDTRFHWSVSVATDPVVRLSLPADQGLFSHTTES